jgi:mRNA export factor
MEFGSASFNFGGNNPADNPNNLNNTGFTFDGYSNDANNPAPASFFQSNSGGFNFNSYSDPAPAAANNSNSGPGGFNFGSSSIPQQQNLTNNSSASTGFSFGVRPSDPVPQAPVSVNIKIGEASPTINNANPNKDRIVQSTPPDSISSLNFSPTSGGSCLLTASSWNKDVCVWQVNSSTGEEKQVLKQSLNAPVLCTAWAPDSSRVFSGACDSVLRSWDLATNTINIIGQHEGTVKEIYYNNEVNCLISGSWDKTIRYWDPRQGSSSAAQTVPLIDRIYAMDVKGFICVAGTADRKVYIFDVRKPTTALRGPFDSPLKYQTRVVRLFPDATGFALASIEGRAAIQHVAEKDSAKNFAFKCHREDSHVYSVNAVSFHPNRTFATAGGDGNYVFWDYEAKQRLKYFQKNSNAITCANFNTSGTLFAYALGYDWSRGVEFYEKHRNPNAIMIAVVDPQAIANKNAATA